MSNKDLLSVKNIQKAIYEIRGKSVMMDFDLAELYGVQTKRLNQAVKRNEDRFPEDFMFQLSSDELDIWRSQFVTSNPDLKMGLRRPPFAFTEHGILMLSSVLQSKAAIEVNIQIMRTFNKMRKALLDYTDLNRKINSLEKRYDGQFRIVFDALKKILSTESKDKKDNKRIGFGR